MAKTMTAEEGRANLKRLRELTRGKVGGYRLECVNGGLAPKCTDCVPCDVAVRVKVACLELREAVGIDMLERAKILASVSRIERAACGGSL